MKKRSVGKGRTTGIIMYEYPPDVFSRPGAPRGPVKATYFKLTREQHYAGLGAIYGVNRKPGQSLRSYAREVDAAVAAAQARHRNKEIK